MFNFVDEIVQSYDPKKKTVSEAFSRMGITTGLDASTDQFGDQQSLSSLYGNVTWVYRSIGFIASNLASVPWIYKKDDEDITDTIIDNIFNNPNPMQTRYDFLVESISRLQMQGEMFWELYQAPSLENQVIAIFPDWRSEEVDIIPDQKKYQIKAYKRTINGKAQTFKNDEVFYLKYFNSVNPIRGMSPLFPARHAASTDLNATFYNKQFFKQGARPSGMMTTKLKLTDIEQRRLEETIKKKYQSVEQMHEILVLWGDLDFKPLNTMSMTDMQFKDLKGMTREEIVTAFGLSMEVLGLGRKTYENVAYYRRLAWTETLQPLLDKFLALLNKDLIEQLYGLEGVTAEADYSNVEALREERSKKVIDFEKGFKTGAVTPNEIRENVFGFDPIDIPEMNSTYLHINIANPVDLPDIQMPEQTEGLRLLGQKRLTYDDRTKIWHIKVKKYEQFEPVFRGMIEKIFDEMNEDIKKKMDLILPKKDAPPSGVFFDTDYWKKRLAEKGTPIIATIMKFAADEILQSEGLVFDPVHPYVRSLIGQRVNNFSTFVSKTTKEDINKLITRTLQETAEMGIAEQTRTLQAVFDKYNIVAKKNRAALIARTETMGASNAGTQAGLVQGGFLRKMWITSRDDRVRDSHQIDGQVVNVDEDFTLADGSSVPFPCDFAERCIMISTIEPKT